LRIKQEAKLSLG